MMMSQIFKFVNFTKTQKSSYLQNEVLFFLQIRKFINYASRATLWENTFVAEVIFIRKNIMSSQTSAIANEN